MFEETLNSWRAYEEILHSTLPDDDIRINRAAEVRVRLRQLDLILEFLTDAISIVTPDAADVAVVHQWAQDNYDLFLRGEISQDDWVGGTSLPRRHELAQELKAWESVTLFTETFYFFAWRIVEALNLQDSNGKLRFPGLPKVNAPKIRVVRNDLLQHPERVKVNQDDAYSQFGVLTTAGPVIRSSAIVMEGATGQTRAADESLDKGIILNALELRDAMDSNIDSAVRRLVEESKLH